MLVYLDQSYWNRLRLNEHRDLLALVSALASDERIVLPVSAVHLLETMKTPLEVRRSVFELMTILSRGWCLRDPISVIKLEFERHRHHFDLPWMRSRLLTKNPVEMFVPTDSILRGVLGLLGRRAKLGAALDILKTVGTTPATTSRVNSILQRGADGVNALRGRLPLERKGLAATLGVPTESLPSKEDDLACLFPSLQVRADITRAITDARPKGLERNDITDVGFLATAIPYFDVVTVDHTMGVRIAEASKAWPFPSNVVSRFEKLGDALKARSAPAGTAGSLTGRA